MNITPTVERRRDHTGRFRERHWQSSSPGA
jgi:hypothetical protein